MTGAFVDRASVDWAALLSRIGSPRDRSSVEALRVLEALRSSSLGPSSAERVWAAIILRALLASAAFQIVLGFTAGVAAAADGLPLSHLAARLVLMTSFAAGSVLLSGAAARDARSLYLAAAFLFAASAFARPVWAAAPGGWPAVPGVLVRGVYPEVFTAAALWQFAVAFPHVRRFTSFDVFARRAATAAWTATAALFVVNLGLTYGLTVPGAQRLARDNPGNLFWHLFAIIALPAIVTILVRARRAPGPERRKVARFAWAIAAGGTPLFAMGLLRMASPGVNEWIVTAAEGERVWVDAIVVGALGMTPLLVTLAVIVDRPFDVQSVLPQRLRQWLGGGILRVLELLRMGAPRRRSHERLAAALDRVRLARGPREVRAVVQRELQFGVGVAGARIFDVTDLPEPTALLPMLSDASGPIDLSGDGPLFALLPRRDRDWVRSHGVSAAVPIKLRDGTIAAIAAVGARTAGRPLDSSDIWFISTLITGAAAAWEPHDRQARRVSRRANLALECPECGFVSVGEPVHCGCTAPVRLAAIPAEVAGKFTVLRRLGAGGMGVVYLARDTALGRDVALKTLPALDATAVSRIRSEARAMAALNHASLATIYGLEVWRRTPILVMEYFPQGTLADRIRTGTLSARDAIAMALTVADGLGYMHARGVLHRDVKPSNIGLTAANAPKLLDFGLATGQDIFAGTPAYLPPEVLDGGPPSAAADLWGLSIVLVESLGGRARVPPALVPFVERALARSPGARFQTSIELRAALAGVTREIDSRALGRAD